MSDNLFLTVFEEAVADYWEVRGAGTAGGEYLGRRGEVVNGKQLDSFLREITLVLIEEAGVPTEWIYWRDSNHGRKDASLPGWYRATKNGDLVVIEPASNGPILRAVIELKVLGGPSYGNNANNRSEEALGNSADLWKAYEEGAYRDGSAPFVGYVMMVEDMPAARQPVAVNEPHFRALEEFRNASYLKRMCILCHRLVADRNYTSTALIASAPPPDIWEAIEMQRLEKSDKDWEKKNPSPSEEQVRKRRERLQKNAVKDAKQFAFAKEQRAQELSGGNYTVPDTRVGPERFFEDLIRHVRPIK